MLNIKHRPVVTLDNSLASLHPMIQKLYAGRGIKSETDIQKAAKHLLPFNLLAGIDDACPLLFEALKQQQNITIVGDFDADGATSTALMILGLKALGFHHVDFKVPNRFEYGYGLSPELANDIVQSNTNLVITVDNGISCVEGVALLKNHNINVIVTDHHLQGNKLPNADAIINPNQHKCDFPSKSLAGVGVAFYLLLGLRAYLREQNWFTQNNLTEPNLAEFIDLVALGTVADVVPLDANNRILVYQGLARIKQGKCRPGIKAILQLANKDGRKVKASDFGFTIGPRLNAAGRLDDMSYGIRCLLTESYGDALRMAEDLTSLNNERKEIEQGMRQEAEAAINTLSITSGSVPNGISVYQDNWHQGVIGIVAGRVKDKYYRPTIAFAAGENEGELKGSARSIQGFHIRDLLDELNTLYPNLIIKFGGHAMAAGLSIKADNYQAFTKAFENIVSNHISDELLTQTTLTDGSLDSQYLNKEFCDVINEAGPWGQGFPEPSFDDVFEIVNQRLVGGKHLKLVLANNDGLVIDAIHFNADLSTWPNPNIKRAQLVYQLDINDFRGESNLQLLVSEIAPA